MTDRSLRILVVDDDPDIRRLVLAFYESAEDRVVVEAADGLEAIERLLEGSFDLIVLDLHMPHLGGLEVTSFVRDDPRHRSTPIVLLTSEKDPVTRNKATARGVRVCLDKPFDPIVFREVVEGILGG